jgi:hypothetical protein
MQSGRGLYAGCRCRGFDEEGYGFGANTNAKLTEASGSKR